MRWDMHVGQLDKRTAIQARHGGSNSRGISAPALGGERNNIMLWWDPKRGSEFGYADGWTRDGETFYFSGTGVERDQSFDHPHSENGRVRDHASNGDHVRLLRYLDDNLVRYVGELRLDPSDPWQWRDGLDRFDLPRKMIQFQFLPVGEVHIDDSDRPRPPVGSQPSLVALPERPAAPEKTALEGLRRRGTRRLIAAGEQLVQQRESELVHAFAAWVEQATGRQLSGLDIPYGVEQRNLRADAYLPPVGDASGGPGLLIEAKANTARETIRLGIGQLLDYRRYVHPHPHMVLLLPSSPADDMLALLDSLRIAAVWQYGPGFEVRGIAIG